MPDLRMVPLTEVASRFEARLLAARLGADGILWQLQGNLDGPYPVGSIAVLVAGSQLDDARALLLSDEVEQAFDLDSRERADAPELDSTKPMRLTRSAAGPLARLFLVAAVAVLVFFLVFLAVAIPAGLG